MTADVAPGQGDVPDSGLLEAVIARLDEIDARLRRVLPHLAGEDARAIALLLNFGASVREDLAKSPTFLKDFAAGLQMTNEEIAWCRILYGPGSPEAITKFPADQEDGA